MLTARVLVLGATQRFDDLSAMLILHANGHDDLSDLNTSDRALRLSVSAAHSRLQSEKEQTCKNWKQNLETTSPNRILKSESDINSLL